MSVQYFRHVDCPCDRAEEHDLKGVPFPRENSNHENDDMKCAQSHYPRLSPVHRRKESAETVPGL